MKEGDRVCSQGDLDVMNAENDLKHGGKVLKYGRNANFYGLGLHNSPHCGNSLTMSWL